MLFCGLPQQQFSPERNHHFLGIFYLEIPSLRKDTIQQRLFDPNLQIRYLVHLSYDDTVLQWTRSVIDNARNNNVIFIEYPVCVHFEGDKILFLKSYDKTNLTLELIADEIY